MPPIGSNARLLSNDVLARGLIEDYPFRIQLAAVFPFHPITGSQLRYANTQALRPGAAIDFCEIIPEDTKAPNDRQRMFEFAELATHFRICYKAQDTGSSNVNDQTAVQMALAIRELLYKFWTLFESGDASRPGEFDGLLKTVESSNALDLKGGPLTLEALDAVKERVRSNDGRGVIIFTSSVGKRAIAAAHWVRQLSPAYQSFDFPAPDRSGWTQNVLTFDGSPVYVNDLNQVFRCGPKGRGNAFSSTDPYPMEPGKACTNIWFFVMGKNNLHGIVPASLGSSMFVTRSTILADGSTLVYHVTMPVAIALGTASALSVIRNAAIPHRA